ncbi:LacI family DNA-binding transcriptional regulator [Victivallis sp. Marseille-Q1083]|uniref:LacI family DNA-binding transcriptional regulator n=1 Tax=Victivallis sp. Marseille-Q1083 TaxID=2717288 RepID=UPI00158DEE28|nr:LacI family DNA-binding transcriptional regulator [Victivallis sp. Marseille-Q1083]
MANIRKKVTQQRIAELTGVSQGIVSAVLRQAPLSDRIPGPTKRRILQVARQNNYPIGTPVERPRGCRNNIIGILLRKENSQFQQDLATGLNDALEALHYRCVFSRINLDGDPAEAEIFLDRIIDYDHAGIICLGHFSARMPDVVPRKLERCPNVVYLNPPRGIGAAPCVRIDYGAGVIEAVRALKARGRKRIALCLNDINCDATKGRFAGYCAGILEAGYPMRPELCWTAEDYQLCGWEGADPAPVVERIMATVVKDRQPDAIIAANDPWAVELIQALKQNKFRVPEDIAVIGFGDYAGYCQSSTPRLTSISHGNDAIIAALVELVDGLVTNRLTGSEADLTDREVKSFLVERESIGRLTEESNVNQP